ncbi:MAG: glycoside hydrolase family 66 protein [Chloroflexota bacterium]|nr:glycoside hydrolase family 66 protein [Chloroflexota bacterium]
MTKLEAIEFTKAYFIPGERAAWDIVFDTNSDALEIQVVISHGQQILDTWQDTKPVPADGRISFGWSPPQDAPVGYGLDMYTRPDPEQEWDLLVSAGFDVLDHWTQTPRYGFLTDFEPDRENNSDALKTLNRFHINGLQFYDWMYKHEEYLTDQDPYIDPIGRELSMKTVRALIREAHHYRMAAMPYTAIYAATYPFFQEHPSWALYDTNQIPHELGDNLLIIMDSRPDSEFGKHLLAEFNDILANTAFDGIHLDQYGYPKRAFDLNGESINVEDEFVEMIDATKALVRAYDPEDTVIFNAVNNWPVNKVADADQDLIYIEVWEPHDYFSDLHQLIQQAQRLNSDKPVVLAAYNDPNNLQNVILSDALIFASGGSHIELGENGNMLQDPYFPNFGTMPDVLFEQMVRMYDFYVRYQDFIGPRTVDASGNYQVSIAERDGAFSIEPILRNGDGFITCSLVNFTDIPQLFWKGSAESPPREIFDLQIKVDGIEKEVLGVWLSSPDSPSLAGKSLAFVQNDTSLTITVPQLSYWGMIVFEVN